MMGRDVSRASEEPTGSPRCASSARAIACCSSSLGFTSEPRRAVERRYPELDERELRVKWVELHCGASRDQHVRGRKDDDAEHEHGSSERGCFDDAGERERIDRRRGTRQGAGASRPRA